MGVLKVQKFFQDNREQLKLSLVTGEAGLENLITTAEINRPGLFLVGYKEPLPAAGLALMGGTEVEYLRQLSPSIRQERISRFLKGGPACITIGG